MTAPICEDEGVLQEWAPVSRLLFQIPAKAQRGIFSQDLKLTCVDVVPEFITLGTNCGLVYWYNRQSGVLQRLRLENTNCAVSCVKIVSTVDFMVAAGTDIGNVTVFQIPKEPPESLPDALKPKGRQVERFTINGLHKASVSCLEWSQNGMKLFSGDKEGTVVLTAIDFQMHLSKSTELLNDQFEVVQLSYDQNILLVSTIYRSIICDGSNNWRVTQLGIRKRKVLGKFGATFCKFEHGTVIYASRPGQRLWLADRAGNVEQTLIFKNAVQSSHPQIALINPMLRKEASDKNFGKIVQFGENRLVSFHSEILYVLHPGAITVVASLSGARKILDVAVSKDEIFILEGDRCLLRIGHAPDPYAIDEVEDVTNRRRSFIFDDIANKIKDTAARITSDLVNSEKLSPLQVGDEALDLPPIVNLPQDVRTPLLPEQEVEVHESIDEPSLKAYTGAIKKIPQIPNRAKGPAEEVICRPGRRRKVKQVQLLQTGVGYESESDSMSTTSDDRLVCGYTNEPSASEDSPTSWSQSHSSFSVLRDLHSLLPQQQLKQEAPRTPDDQSQASIDTCESVSENMRLTPDLFRDEQEKTFLRLANQSMLDSFNSERTENMSISINITPSSSASSKLSDNILSSEASENVSMASESDSQTDPPGCDIKLPVPEQLPQSEETSSVSSGHSQKIIPKDIQGSRHWNKELILSQMLGLDLEDPLNRQQKHHPGAKQQLEEEAKSSVSSYFPDCPTPLADSTDSNSLLPESDQILATSKGSEAEPSEDNKSVTPLGCESADTNVGTKENRKFSLADCKLEFSEADTKEDRKLVSLDGLSYGPPSGSSMLSSCHPSLDLNSGLTVLSNPQALVVEKSDRWLQYKTPESLSSLVVCDNYVVCVDTQNQVFYSQLSGISLTWAPLDYRSMAVAVSPDAKLVWLQGEKSVMALLKPSLNGPFADEAVEAATNIRSFALDKTIAYYVTRDGRIKCQRNLNRSPVGRSEHVHCPWLVTSVFCRNGIVLALTTDEMLIYKNETSSEFIPLVTASKVTSAVALGPANFVWIVDPHNNLFFSDDYESAQPHWWQVLISEYIFQNSLSTFLNMHNRVRMGNLRGIQLKQTLVAANGSSVWVYNKFSSCVHVNKLNFTGYIWEDITLKSMIKCVMICVHGVFEEKGHIWLVSVQGDLFCASPATPTNVQSISSPCNSDIVCIASAPDTLWVLTSEGSVYARLGLTDSSLTGTSWRELRLPQLTDQQLKWITCGCDVAWCVDIAGRVFITLVPPHDMATNVFDAAWLEVEGKPKDNSKFVKVFVGPHMHMVWALDSQNQIYVREGIFPHYQIGTGWVHVGGIKSVHLSISSTAVWALAPGGAVYRRHGISESNYIGDYWRRVPGSVTQLSVTFSDEVWSVTSCAGVARLLQRRVSLENETERRNVSIGECDDWMVVE